MAKLTRDTYRPYLDINRGSGEYEWVRIDKSTVFDVEFNAESETVGYIDSANDSTDISSYAPTMEQEIILDSSNAMYQFIEPFCWEMPTGTDAVVPCMLTEADASGGNTYTARVWDDATITPGDLNSVDGKLVFTLNLNGTPTVGTAEFADDGSVTFIEEGSEEEVVEESEGTTEETTEETEE